MSGPLNSNLDRKKWKLTEWKINGKDLWSKEAWMEIAEVSKEIRIKVYHVCAHQNKDDLQTKYNNEADRLASMTIKLKAHYQGEQTGLFCLKTELNKDKI